MATHEWYGLPEDFLARPSPNLTKTTIDFAKADLGRYANCWAVVLDGVMSEEECDALTAAAEASTGGKNWERAMVNVGGGEQRMYEDVRKCGRIIWDDRDLVARLWARCEAAVPEIHRLQDWASVTGPGPVKRKEVWRLTRPNERMRFLKYKGGEYFKPHQDGCYETPDGTERSYFTLHLYLNDAEGKPGQEPLKGGATSFHSYMDLNKKLDVIPKAGRVLMFQHRDLLHSGADVEGGIKLTLRTDLMYTKEEDGEMIDLDRAAQPSHA